MKLEPKNSIFRFGIHISDDKHTWVLEGRLAGEVVDELRASWKRAVTEEPQRKRVVDLAGVTCVDEYGEQALLEMKFDNAQFAVRGVYMKSLLASLSGQGAREA
jgi:ABC-type transporter Mla MlaB component